MHPEEGSSEDNEGAPFWDASVQAWVYASGRQLPSMHHEFSPPMSEQALAEVVVQSLGTEQQWMDAHPPAVKTWLQTTRTPAQRIAHKVGCQQLKLLRDRLNTLLP